MNLAQRAVANQKNAEARLEKFRDWPERPCRTPSGKSLASAEAKAKVAETDAKKADAKAGVTERHLR